jgi:hypothetical protein
MKVSKISRTMSMMREGARVVRKLQGATAWPMCPRCNSIKIRIVASTRHEGRGELDTPVAVAVVVVVGGVVERMEIQLNPNYLSALEDRGETERSFPQFLASNSDVKPDYDWTLD